MTSYWNKVITWLFYCIATVIILFASLVVVSRLLAPYLADHKPQFETWASELLKVPVKIGKVSVSWAIYEPEILLSNVTILDKKTQQPTITIQQVLVNFDILRTVIARMPVTELIKISGVHLTIHQFKEGQFHIEGLMDMPISDSLTGASVKSGALFEWIFSNYKLVLRKIDIRYIPEKGSEKSIILDRLLLKNSGSQHLLKGQVLLDQEMPLKMIFALDWKGDFSDIKHIAANLDLYLEGLSLPQFLQNKTWHQMQVKDGVGSFKISLKWDLDQLQMLHTQFQLYQLSLQSLVNKKIQTIPRIMGNVAWKRRENGGVLTGDDILIDFPTHFWPSTQFDVNYTVSAEGSYAVQNINVGYLNLADVTQVALDSGLLSDAMKNPLSVLKMKGDIRKLHAQTKNSWDNLSDVSISAQFTGLTFNEWQKYPGVKNLNGLAAWDGKSGELKLDSPQSTINMSSQFSNPLVFDQLKGYLDWQKQENNSWVISAKRINLINADINAVVNMKLAIPEKDSPVIDFKSDFNVTNVAQIAKYLPLKTADAGLTEWLKNAFHGGKIELGKAVLEGRLSDYPFVKTPGKFEVTALLGNVDLNFAPKWPWLRQVSGTLNFSGPFVIIDIASGIISKVPAKQVHAIISNVGTADPTTLALDASFTSDLSNGLAFIHDSPLQNTLGKDLAALDLSGGMDLKLKLFMPLKNPDDIKIIGDLAIKDAKLNLADWNLMIDNLQGAMSFTENSINSPKLDGRLFNNPVQLDLSTKSEAKKSKYLQANLKGIINIADLQKWLKISLSDYLQGATEYKAELHLGSSGSKQPNELILNSDLKGVSVKLPEQYGKKAQEPIDFRLDVFFAQNQPLKVKMDYGKLLSAAVALKSQKQQWQLLGGELRLGPGAQWQSQPGILMTGQIDKLNWATIQKYLPANNSISDNSLIRGLDVNIGSLDLLGQTFKNMRLQLAKVNSSWQVGLSNENIRGEVMVPANLKQQPIQAKFERLYLTTNGAVSNDSLSPKKIPALIFSGENVRINDKYFGHVKFFTVPSASGLTIKDVDIESDILQLHAIGSWISNGKRFITRLQGEASSTKLSEVLTQWGFNSSNFVGGKGEVKFDLSWPDTPFHPTENGLSGNLSMDLGEGRIVDIGDSETKMGFGRLLSILSLQNIPKRLSLNFSDLTQKGYSFDSIKGNVTFKSGNAFADKIHLAGSVADINISGRIGLAAKDFDVKLSVTPHLTSSLPLVATAVGGPIGPIAGIATWFVDKLVTSKIITYHYKVTGPWDKADWSQEGSK